MILAAALNTTYALGLSLGVRTSVSAGGFSQWPCIGLFGGRIFSGDTGLFRGTADKGTSMAYDV